MRFLTVFLALIFYGGFSYAGTSSVTSGAQNIKTSNYNKKVEARMIVSDFLERVDGGEISLFGEPLSRDMLDPVKVAHEYEIASDGMIIMIYSQLTQPLPMPQADQYSVVGISVFLDPLGEINQIKAHVKTQ